jgi:hypothetical protein
MKAMFLATIFIFFMAVAADQAIATPILTIDAPDRVRSGSLFIVTVGISGMDADVDLGAFDLNFSLVSENSLYSASHIHTDFMVQLGNPLTEAISYANPPSSGRIITINAYQISLLWDLSFQTDSFDLVRFWFDTPSFIDPKNNRDFILVLHDVVLSDSSGMVFDVYNPGIKRMTVVPEPVTIALFSLGLIGIGFAKRSRKS